MGIERIELPIEQAFRELTGFEVLGIQRHYALDMAHFGSTVTLLGTVWAYKCRAGEKPTWDSVERMTLEELRAFFPQTDPDPESPQADLLPASTPRPTDWRTSASAPGTRPAPTTH